MEHTRENMLTDEHVDDHVTDESVLQNEDTNKKEDNAGLIYKLRTDPKFRLKVYDTACLWWGFFVFGWSFTLVGPTLPDLQILLDVDLETAAWLFASCYFGYMVGCILFGILTSRVHLVLLLFISVFGLSLTATLTPWCPWFWLMLIVRIINGFFFGGIDTCCHSRLFALWKTEAHTWVQIMYFHFSVGGLLAPLATEPFLIPKTESSPGPVNLSVSVDGFEFGNGSSLSVCNTTICMDSNSTSVVKHASPEDVRVHYAFLIAGALSFLACLPLLISYVAVHRFETKEKEEESETVQRKTPSRFLFYLVLGLMASFFLIVTGWIETFSSMMMTFSVTRIQWTKHQGAYLNSMMWIAYAVGNFACIFLVQCFSSGTLLMSFVIGSVVGLIGMCIASHILSSPLVWISVIITGFFMSIMWPACFTWTEENVTPVSGKVASLFLVSGSIGFMINPLIVTVLMEGVSYMWYTYVHLIEGLILLGIFITAVLLFRRVAEPDKVQVNSKGDVEDNKTKLLVSS